MKSHILHQHRGVKLASWDVASKRPTSNSPRLERDERPIIAVDFAVRQARANDGKADDDLETFLATVYSSAGCMHAIASET